MVRLAFVLLVLAGAVPSSVDAAPPGSSIDSVFIGTLPDARPGMPVTITISPDGRNAAFKTHLDGEEALVVNGATGARYAEVGPPVFGANGSFAHVARRGSERHVIVGEREVARIPPGDDVSDLHFDRDGQTIVFVRHAPTWASVFVGDSAGVRYPKIVRGSVRIRPKSNAVTYVAENGDKRFVVAAGVEPVGFDDVLPPIFGASDHLAYLATRGSMRLVVSDRGAGHPWDEVLGLALDPESGVPVYAAASGRAWHIVVDTTDTPVEGLITDVCVSPVGGHVAYAVQRGRDYFVVRDSTTEGPYETVVEGSLSFSQDGRHLAYEAERHDEFFVVADGREGRKYSDVVNGSIQMSPDGLHLVYLAENDGKQFLVLDGVEDMAHEGALALALSPNASHTAFAATDLGQVRIVIDGVAGPAWDSIVGDQLNFDGEERLHYIARRGLRLYRVDEFIPSSDP